MNKIVRLLLTVFTALTFFPALAQQRPGNYAGTFLRKGNEITVTGTGGTLKLDLCTPAMFRVRVSFGAPFPADEHLMVTHYHWDPVACTVDSLSRYFQVKTAALRIMIRKAPLSVDVYDSTGKLLCSESNTASSDGGSFRRGDTVGCRKMLQPDEHFFGFGERMDFLDRRGRRLVLEVGRGEAKDNLLGAYNTLKANYCPVPFFMSTRGYGIFLHNSWKNIWDMGSSSPDSYSFSATGGSLDYYFMYGPRFPAILKAYASLTGASPLLPEFALGLQVGTYSGGTWGHEDLASPEYVLNLVRMFRKYHIPIDILFLDSTWRLFASGGHGATTFEWRKAFGDPEKMFDSLYAMHLHEVGLHIRPRLDNGPRYHLLSLGQQAGAMYPENGKPGEFPNYFDSTAVDWWWDHAVMKVASIGAMFLKTDEGSAFGRKANESDKTGPQDSVARSLHNVFPLAYTGAAFRKFKQYNGIRGMNQTREGYAGIQRFPYIFAGDWPSQWQYFAPVVKAGLNTGISGVGYWSHCMGGFEQKADPELYIRWCQFGMLSPVAMVFGMDHPGYKEPWNYGSEALLNFKKYDSLRYCLMPYLYSAAWQLYKTGMPLMRALVLDYQDDPNVYTIGDQYLLGDDLMVCPVTVKGARSRVVYLPEGTWYDYWTGEKYEGKKYITVLCPLLQIPMFVKAGALIPMQPEMQYVGQKPVDTLSWDVFPGDSSVYTLYEDDRKSMDYTRGDYALTRLSCTDNGRSLDVDVSAPHGEYRAPEKHYIFRIRLAAAPAAVRINGKMTTGWHYDNDAGILTVRPAEGSSHDIRIAVGK